MLVSFEPTFNAILMIAIGVGMVGLGIWLMFEPFTRVLGFGLFFTGIGNILFGLTNGFINITPTGRLLFRIAVFVYLLGIPALIYAFFELAA